jgi:uncharacterized protein (DUF2141 family)
MIQIYRWGRGPGGPLLLVVLGTALLGAVGAPRAMAATSTSFSPSVVALPPLGTGISITVTTAGLAANVNAVSLGIRHPSSFSVSAPACVGLFAGGFAVPAIATTYGTSIGCGVVGSVSGNSGSVMTFVLTRTGGGAATITFDQTDTFFVHLDQTTESPGTTGTLQVGEISEATTTSSPTATPTSTSTPTPTSTPSATGLVGDINGDGIVDIRDYGLWRQHFGETSGAAGPSRATALGLIGDINGDGIVDIRDYGIWRQHFGETSGAAARSSLGTPPAPAAPAQISLPSLFPAGTASPTSTPTPSRSPASR